MTKLLFLCYKNKQKYVNKKKKISSLIQILKILVYCESIRSFNSIFYSASENNVGTLIKVNTAAKVTLFKKNKNKENKNIFIKYSYKIFFFDKTQIFLCYLNELFVFPNNITFEYLKIFFFININMILINININIVKMKKKILILHAKCISRLLRENKL